MHPAIPITLAEAEQLPTRLLFQAEVMAEHHRRVERWRRLKAAARSKRGRRG